ncbi:hypothetical protein GCM10009606_19200 [Nocardioides aquiterrae]|uniref:PASTA domain-containing protein n=1 Tax=Nocardioides aquiterrae TaxID=203799 RepID=A0ABP4F0W2_9ACTN
MGDSGTLAWWQTWWVIVPGLFLCLPLGLVALWFRRGTSTGLKAVVSIATVAFYVVALAVSPSDESEPASAPPAAETDRPSPTAEPTVTPTAEVPKLKGMTKQRAERKLRAAGLEPGTISHRPTAARAGTILAQGVAGGTSVAVGTEVALVVAVPFPRSPTVVGQTAGVAEARLRRAGYAVKRVYRTRTSGRNGEVIGQSPRGGVPVRKGSTVTLTVLRVVAPPPPPQPVNCTPGYSPCLPPAPDYDCAGGSGDGPAYTGPVRVTGYDPYGLDADGDGTACNW